MIDASAPAQAQTQLERVCVLAADVAGQQAVMLHALAALLGQPASAFTLPPEASRAVVPAVPPGLSSQLLERRPDIAAAERRVAAANAGIGVAKAPYYPDLKLSVAAGLESSFLTPWLSAPSLFWAVRPQLAQALFDGGKRNAQLGSAQAQYDGAVADYRQAVLLALQQVEDELSSLAALAEQQQHQALATAAAHALRLSVNRLQAGAVSYLEVATARAMALQNQRFDEELAARRLTATVALIRSVGRDWHGLAVR